jgi:chemotaxis protein CheY-P-specific phosphatase CheC
MNKQLDTMEKDILLETASIAAGRAIKPLQNFFKRSVSISLPKIELKKIEVIADTIGQPEAIKEVVVVGVIGDGHGAVVLVVDEGFGKKLFPKLSAKLIHSALEESVNIVSGTVLGGISKLLNMKFNQTVPSSTTGMLRATINEVVTELGSSYAEVICMPIQLKFKGIAKPAYLYLFFDVETTAKIIKAGKLVIG